MAQLLCDLRRRACWGCVVRIALCELSSSCRCWTQLDFCFQPGDDRTVPIQEIFSLIFQTKSLTTGSHNNKGFVCLKPGYKLLRTCFSGDKF